MKLLSLCYIYLYLSIPVNYKKPALTKVQRPTPAIILFQLNNLPNNLLIQFKSTVIAIFFFFSVTLLQELIPIKF